MGLLTYIKETKAELKHVSWPTRSQAFAFTILVIVLSITTAIYLGVFDYIFTTILQKVI